MEASAGRQGTGSQKGNAMVIGNEEFEFPNSSITWNAHHFFWVERVSK